MIRVLLATIIMIPFCVSADDVYNFYFQKAPGPTTVIQGGAQPPPPVATEKAQSVAVTEKANDRANDYKKWEVMGGYGTVSDQVDRFRGFGLSANYNFDKYVGLSAGIIYAKDAVNKYYEVESARSPLDFSLGLVITPVRIRVVGFDLLDIGFLLGVMSQTSIDGGGPYQEVTFYTGPRLVLNFNESVGFAADFKLTNNGQYGQALAGIGMRF